MAGGQLAEIVTIALIEKGLIDREEICAELETLADARRTDDSLDGISGKLIELANSLRAARTRRADRT